MTNGRILKLKKTKEELENDLKCFVWDFKVGDNINYNLDILYTLIDDFNKLYRNYSKPISIITVSIIEAIMIDFTYRLYDGTSHFPDSLKGKENEIKSNLAAKTKKIECVDNDGNKHEYSVLKNFNFTLMIEIYRELKLFGDNKKVYKFLTQIAYFRNRIHIKNYFNNFEKDEGITFSTKRTQDSLNVMVWCFNYFKDNYKRPWKNGK